MSEPSIIGSSRTADVLDPTFLEGLTDREFLSYLRRLLQVRQDVLAAERGQRKAGGEPEPLVDRLTAVLSKGGKPNGTRGEAIRTTLSDADLEEAERQAEAMLPPLNLDHADDMNDEEVEQAVRSLAEAERAVSSRRAAVIRVHDRLQEELKQRYRDNPAEIPTGV